MVPAACESCETYPVTRVVRLGHTGAGLFAVCDRCANHGEQVVAVVYG